MGSFFITFKSYFVSYFPLVSLVPFPLNLPRPPSLYS
jgi:hypothetical protein